MPVGRKHEDRRKWCTASVICEGYGGTKERIIGQSSSIVAWTHTTRAGALETLSDRLGVCAYLILG